MDATLKQTVTDKHKFLLPKVKQCMIIRLDKNGDPFAEFNFKVGPANGEHIGGICRFCFAASHLCTEYTVRKCTKELIESDSDDISVDNVLNDRSNIASNAKFVKDLKDLATSNKIKLKDEEINVMTLPNSSNSRFCYTWINWYSSSFGDHIPNSNEIHLTTVEKEELWMEYKLDVGSLEAVSYSHFVYIFNNHFPHVGYCKLRYMSITKVFCDVL
jgi:hypothetical protein